MRPLASVRPIWIGITPTPWAMKRQTAKIDETRTATSGVTSEADSRPHGDGSRSVPRTEIIRSSVLRGRAVDRRGERLLAFGLGMLGVLVRRAVRPRTASVGPTGRTLEPAAYQRLTIR